MTEAALFHRCRKALGLSQPMMARLLLIASDRTIRRWEQGELTVAGPAWVALGYLLKEGDEMALADKVAEVVAATLAGNVLGRKIRSAYAG